jgi:glycosyltransferase involved in cell wall biosynthesis
VTLVSVVIPCYKDSATLGRAIRSVQAQTHAPIELIIVNDCSPETEDIERCLAGFPEVRYLRNVRNLGLAATRNEGLKAATGEFIAFLDADDEYHPRKIELQLRAHRPGSVVTCRFQEVLPERAAPIADLAGADMEVSEVTEARRLRWRNTLNGAGLLAPRDLLLEVGGYEPAMRSCEDFDLWLRLLERGVCALRVELPLYLYYFNPSGLSKNDLNISRWELEAIVRHRGRQAADVQRGVGFGSLLAYWLLKHFFRCERSGNVALRNVTLENTALLADWPLIRFVVRNIGRLRLLALPARLMACARSSRGVS